MRRVTLVTTLMDAENYPAREILQAYLRRWRLEMCLDDLKTTLQMEMLRIRSPEMAQKEVYARLIGHNLIRCTMAHAAAEHTVALERIGFEGIPDALCQFTHAMSQAQMEKAPSLVGVEIADFQYLPDFWNSLVGRYGDIPGGNRK